MRETEVVGLQNVPFMSVCNHHVYFLMQNISFIQDEYGYWGLWNVVMDASTDSLFDGKPLAIELTLMPHVGMTINHQTFLNNSSYISVWT